jgi:deaminated glutathione amidase
VSGEFAIAVAQFAPGPDGAENLATITRLATEATNRGAKLIVFPEYSSFFVDPLGPRFAEAAQGLDGEFPTGLGRLAASLGVFIVAGLVERVVQETHFSNTLLAFSPNGELLATYRKQHLYDAFGARESDWVIPGPTDPPLTFTVEGLIVGMQTCYDIRFPEVSRRLVDAGAELILVPAEWVRGPQKERHWRTLLSARAIENTVYVAAADHTPPIGVGVSAIIDPFGIPLAELGESTGVAIAWISSERVAQVRRVNPSLAVRRYRVEPA